MRRSLIFVFAILSFTNTAAAHHSGGGGGYRYTYRCVPTSYSYYSYGPVQRQKSFEAAIIPEINKAKKTIVLVAKRISSWRTGRALAAAQKRGVKIQIISEVKNKSTKLLDSVTRYEDNINQFGGEFAIIDGEEFISGLSGKYNFISTSQDYIKVYQDDFNRTWETCALTTKKTRPSPWPKPLPKTKTFEIKLTTPPPAISSESVVDRLEKMLKTPAGHNDVVSAPYKSNPITEDKRKLTVVNNENPIDYFPKVKYSTEPVAVENKKDYVFLPHKKDIQIISYRSAEWVDSDFIHPDTITVGDALEVLAKEMLVNKGFNILNIGGLKRKTLMFDDYRNYDLDLEVTYPKQINIDGKIFKQIRFRIQLYDHIKNTYPFSVETFSEPYNTPEQAAKSVTVAAKKILEGLIAKMPNN